MDPFLGIDIGGTKLAGGIVDEHGAVVLQETVPTDPRTEQSVMEGVSELAQRLLHHTEPLMVTHQMLADELGTTREVVSRTLESFQESGMLRLGRKRIEILDRTALDRVHREELT